MILLFLHVLGAWKPDILLDAILVIFFACGISFLILNRRWRGCSVYFSLVLLLYQFDEYGEVYMLFLV